MKHKNVNANATGAVLIVVLLGVIGYLVTRPREVVRVEVPVNVPFPEPMRQREPVRRRQPEFRDPPIKDYKPGHVQQMGVLLGEDNETLPLYGKEVRGRRDQYHYYTSTPGQQIYSIPVTVEGRDCMDDMGCKEMYGNENVNVLGKAAPYQAKLYRTDNFF
jgi:hypothetical protein|tara:strand:+ start:70 stop:552 length:483 start_codon:yes stop_codon:yes gene_type:complete